MVRHVLTDRTHCVRFDGLTMGINQKRQQQANDNERWLSPHGHIDHTDKARILITLPRH